MFSVFTKITRKNETCQIEAFGRHACLSVYKTQCIKDRTDSSIRFCYFFFALPSPKVVLQD